MSFSLAKGELRGSGHIAFRPEYANTRCGKECRYV